MKHLLFLLCFFLLPFCLRTQSLDTRIWNSGHLMEVKAKIKRGDANYLPSYQILLKKADNHLKTDYYSVMNKQPVPKTGDKHDYMSMAPYSWPDSTKQDGLPYINRDGQRNPELNQYDRNSLGSMCEMVADLSLAYYFSEKSEYAEKAAEQIRTWFLNPETKMNPNLNFAQFIPGKDDSKGRSYGIIDVYSFLNMLEGVAILEQSPAFPKEDTRNLQAWFTDFLQWLKTSKMGLEEKEAKNNHGLAYDAMCGRFALFVNDTVWFKNMLTEFPKKRLYPQIEPDGSQPLELKRTLALHYTLYNLDHILDICQMAGKKGEEIYFLQSPDGRSIGKAVDFIAPYIGKSQSDFPYQQIHGWDQSQNYLCWVLKRASVFDPSKKYDQLFLQNYKPNYSERNYLIYY